MDQACSTHRTHENAYTFGRKTLQNRDNLEDPHLDRRIILKWDYNI